MDISVVSIEYITADGKRIFIEVSNEVKELLEQSDRNIRSQRRQDRRYLDRGDFIDGLTDAAMRYPQQADAANLVIRRESYRRLYSAINKLSEKQKRRLLLHYENNLTHRQIADLEGINRATVSRSIETAIKLLQMYLSDKEKPLQNGFALCEVVLFLYHFNKRTNNTQARICKCVVLGMLVLSFVKGGEGIKVKEAIVWRFRQLCAERNISYTELARLAGVTPSTVYSMLQPERKDISAVTVKKLCDGLDLCIADFYNCDLFRNLSPEIE